MSELLKMWSRSEEGKNGICDIFWEIKGLLDLLDK